MTWDNIIILNTIYGIGCTVYPYTFLGKVPKITNKMYRKIEGNLPPLKIGDNCIIGSFTVIFEGAVIGDNVFIGDHVWIRERVEIGDGSVIGRGVSINYNTKIGKGVRIMENSQITGNMIIEDGVWIGPMVVSMNDKRFNPDDEHKGPIIRKNTKIGGGVILMPGIEIGENCIVASGTVINQNIPPNHMVYNPKNISEVIIKERR